MRKELTNIEQAGKSRVALRMEVLDGLLVTDTGSANLLIADLKLNDTNSVTDVRRVVYGLHPPGGRRVQLDTDDRRVDRVRSGYPELSVCFDVPEQLPSRSAATKVAVYRIAVEAFTNVARHADAHACTCASL